MDSGRFFSRANIEIQCLTRDALAAILDDCCHDCHLTAMRSSPSYRRFYRMIREADSNSQYEHFLYLQWVRNGATA